MKMVGAYGWGPVHPREPLGYPMEKELGKPSSALSQCNQTHAGRTNGMSQIWGGRGEKPQQNKLSCLAELKETGCPISPAD